MELKFVVFVFLVLFAVLGCIETEGSSGGVRRSSGQGNKIHKLRPFAVSRLYTGTTRYTGSHRRSVLRLPLHKGPVRKPPRKPQPPKPHPPIVRKPPRKPQPPKPHPPIGPKPPRKPQPPKPHPPIGPKPPRKPQPPKPHPPIGPKPPRKPQPPKPHPPIGPKPPRKPQPPKPHPPTAPHPNQFNLTTPRPTTASPILPFSTVPTPRNTDLPRPATPTLGFILHNTTSRPTAPPVGWSPHHEIHHGTNQTSVHTTHGPHYSTGNESGVHSPGWIGMGPSTPKHSTNYTNLQGTNSGSNSNITTPSLHIPYSTPNSTNVEIDPVTPLIPSHTVSPVVGGPEQPGYQKTKEDILKEALIDASAKILHKALTPNNKDKNSTPPAQVLNTVVITNTYNTDITIHHGQNHGGPGNGSGNTTRGENGGNNYPNLGNYSNVSSSGGSQIPTGGQSHLNQNNGTGQVNNEYIVIYDYELLNITEKLFSLDENNASRFISLNLQKQIEANDTSNITDQSTQPLFSIQPEAYSIPTVRAIRPLYQIATEIENKTREDSRREEALLVDLILNTNVMTAAMDFLAHKGLIKNDNLSHRDMLKDLWFTQYDGFSSGFKRIFQGEMFEGKLWGIQDWIAFDFHEKSGRANYLSYIAKIDLGKSSPNTAILKTNFQMNGIVRIGTTLFIGISTELQMALYTICYHTRRNDNCDVSLGGTQVRIYTYAQRYSGKDLINVAFPIL